MCPAVIGNRACGFQLGERHLRETNVANLALLLQRAEFAELILQRDLRVDALKLQKIDALEAEVPQVELDLLAEVFGPAQRGPFVGTLAAESHLAGDHETVGVGVQRLTNEAIGHERPVGIGRIDERDAKLCRATKHRNGTVMIDRFAPHSEPGKLHRPETEPIDDQIAADEESAGCLGGANAS